MATYKEMLSQIIDNLKELSAAQKMIGGVFIIVVFGLLFGLSMQGNKADYKVLYSGLSQEDAGDVLTRLKESRIPYRLANSGTSIMVPVGQVYETRLTLAGDGLPRGGGVGFEIFDKTNFGTTDFVQRLNYQRALQGELARTIRQFQQIQEARVHIATPKESVFVEDEKPPTASISVKLRGRQKLTQLQIQSIVNLVASAVPGMSTDNITLVDTTGRLLYRKGGDEDGVLSATQQEYQIKLERNMSRKIETMLEEVVGVNKVMAQVTAELEFNRVNFTEESFDPEGKVVRSEQTMTEGDSREGLTPQGVPGVKGDLATFNDAGGSGSDNSNYQRNNITRNYEISHTTKHVQEATGIIKRLSVAVMVDGTYAKEAGADGAETLQYKPRSAADMARFDKLVKNAIGYSEERGDQVEVASMAFTLSMVPEPPEDVLARWRDLIERMAMPIFYLIAGFCVFLFVVKPFFRAMATQPLAAPAARRRVAAGATASPRGPEAILDEEDISLQPKAMTDKERIFKLAQSDPDRAADLVRRWLREEG